MSLLKAMVDDVFSRRDVSVHDVLTKHVNDTFRQRTDGLWEERAAVVGRLETLRDAAQSVTVSVVNELVDDRSYAERHIVTVVTRDDAMVSCEVFVFGELDETGRFLTIEETSLPVREKRSGGAE